MERSGRVQYRIMAEANDSITVTPGAGVLVATQLINGKEYQVLVEANANGQLVGDIPTYSAYTGNVTGAANRPYMHIFNAAGSGKTVKVKKLFIQPQGTAVTGVSQTWRLALTSTAGTGTAATIRLHDSTYPAVPAQVTAAHSHSVAPTETYTWWEMQMNPEETLSFWGATSFYNLLPVEGDLVTDYVINPGEGLLLKNVTGLAAVYSCLAVFSIE